MRYIFFFTIIISTNGRAKPDTTQPSGLRILTYNIHHANPPSRADFIDADAVAAAIKRVNPDLVALQEIDANNSRSGKNLQEADYIAGKLGMKAYFAQAIEYGGGGYGIAILSKFPISKVKKYALPTLPGTNGEPRVLATAEIQISRGRSILFACTHLDAQKADSNRNVQMARILEIFKDEKLPVILSGDLNADPSSEAIRMLDSKFTRTCKEGCGFTIPQVNPRKTIDYISFRPQKAFTVKLNQVINEPYASDHLPVLAVLLVN